jgi:hypothetical protein
VAHPHEAHEVRMGHVQEDERLMRQWGSRQAIGGSSDIQTSGTDPTRGAKSG